MAKKTIEQIADANNSEKIIPQSEDKENFEYAVSIVLQNEGGYVNHKNDKGGATKYGISLNFLKANRIDINKDGIIDNNDVMILDIQTAKQIYYDNFWRKAKCNLITDKHLASNVLDTAVMSGVSKAIKLLQQSLNKLGANLSVDGVLGQKTIDALVKQDPVILNNTLVNERISYYESIAITNPTQKVFLRGWINRAKRFLIQ